MTEKTNKTSILVECALLTAISFILSFFQVNGFWAQGGSITLGSMIPIVIASYRHGLKWGFLTGLVSGVLQMFMGLPGLRGNSLGVLIAAVFLDYILAFMAVGFGGMFRKRLGGLRKELVLGAIVGTGLRFLCHFVSGILIWGSYAPEKYVNAIPLYSFVYNGSYMIPEMIITAAAVFLLAPAIKKVLFFKGHISTKA